MATPIRLSDAARAARGTLRPCRRKVSSVGPAGPVGECPPTLSDGAREEYGRIVDHLARYGLLTPLDKGLIVCYAMAYDNLLNYEELDKGARISTRAQLVKLMLDLADELGMSPKARLRLSGVIDAANTGGDEKARFFAPEEPETDMESPSP